jgi:phosphoserine phosphatase RsbU/P
MNGDQRLPQDLLDKLQAALGLGLTESRKALRLLLEFANRDLKGQEASVLTPSDDDSLRFFESTNETFLAEDFPAVPIGASIAGFVFLSGQSMGLDDAQQSTRFYADIDERSGFHTKEYLATPVVLGENVLGVLTVANRSETLDNPMFSGKELRLADMYAHLCALVLDHDNHIRRQTAATTRALRQTLSINGAGGLSKTGQSFGSGSHSRAAELKAQVKDSMDVLAERDLELIRDLTEHLADLSSRNLS